MTTMNSSQIPLRLVTFAVAVLVAVLLAACGGANPDPAAEPPAAPESEPTTQPATESTVAHDGTDRDDHADAAPDIADPVADGPVDTGRFFDGALVTEPTVADCTLSDGQYTTCFEITIAGYPADGEVGPFCPRTTAATADDVGIWFDGNGLYDLDGEFIVALPEIYNDDAWQLADADGTVNVTDTAEAFDAAARPDVDPAYQNHCVEGSIEWLDGGEPVATTVLIPVTPVMAESATRINGSVGVTLNGVIIDGPAPVDAILGAYTIAAFDDCGGHINPVAGYHIHGATGCSEIADPGDGDTAAFAYALDGFAIHSPLDDPAAMDLDECNGHTSEASGYHYHAHAAQENGVLTCLMGLTAGSANAGGRSDRPAGGPGQDNAAGAASPGAETSADPIVTTGDSTQNIDTVRESAETVGYLGSYSLIDETYGTMVSVTVEDGTRAIVANSLPDHDTGQFPNSGNPNTISEQSLVLEFASDGTYVGNAGFAQQPGIAVNGVAFEPGTAESVSCTSGENYRIEGLQDLYNLGMDFNNAHVQPTGKYHYHGIAELLVANQDTGDDLVLVGFAADGFLMYYSTSGAYDSGYQLSTEARSGTGCTASGPAGGSEVAIDGSTPDGTYGSDWEWTAAGDLDECNGIEIDRTYAYVLTDEYPYIPRCLNGEFTATGPGAGPAGGGASPDGVASAGAPAGGPPNGSPPDFDVAGEILGVTGDELRAALGGPPPDLDAAAVTLGISAEDLEAALAAAEQ